MAIFNRWELTAIREFMERNGRDPLIKVVDTGDRQFRMSSVLRRAHTHRATPEHVKIEDMKTQVKWWYKTIVTITEKVKQLDGYAMALDLFPEHQMEIVRKIEDRRILDLTLNINEHDKILR